MAIKTAKLSIAVEPELKATVGVIAAERNIKPSEVVLQCLKELAREHKENQMIKYYETMAGEHRDFSKKSVKIIQKIASSWGD